MKNSPSRVRNFPVKKFTSPHAVLLCMVLLSLWCGSAHPVLAGPEALTSEKSTKAVTVQDVWSLPGIFGGGVKTTEDYTEGNVFLVVPVISTVGQDGLLSGDVLFIEPYSSWGEQGEVAASLGLGWRHYFTTQSVSAVTKHDGHQAGFFEEGVYVGANVFVDMLDTQFNNQFWQLGVGAEVGTRYLEIRGNYYIPLTDKQLAYEQRRKYSYQTTSSSTSQQVSAGTPYAVGNTLAQDLQYTTLTTTTTSTTTIEQLFRLYEEGMEGWDIQASVLVPGLDRWIDVFLIGGYFSFDNQPFGPQTGGSGNVKGWKAGLEVRPVPAVVLNATWYEDKRFVGSDWLYGMRLEIPFEMGDLGDGKGFWDRVGAAFTPRRRHLAERLVEPVRRQNTAIKVGNETEEKTDVSTSVKRVTKVVSQSPQQLVLADDVIFVNNGSATTTGIAAGSASGTGTAEQPVDTIQAGTDIAVTNSVATSRIWNVYTQGGVDYLTGATVPGGGGVRYIGSHMPLQGGDKTYMTGHIPTILGSLGLQAPNGGTYFGVFGYVFNGGTILAENYNEVEIEGNTLNSSNGTGITVRGSTVTTSDVKVLNNFVNNATGSGIVITAEGITQMQSQISGNAVGAAGAYGIHLQAFDEATLDALVSGNQIQAPELDGIRVDALNEAAVNAILDGNAIVDAGVNGIALRTADAADLTATVDDNYISNAGTTGLQVRSENSVPGIGTGITVDITGNAILESGTHGVDLYTSANDLTATLTGNLIRGTVLYYGTYLHGDGGTVHATFTGNSYVENINGFHVYTDTDGASIDATFEGNYFNKGEVWLDRTDDLAALDLTFRQNHFLNSYLTAWSPSNLTAEGNLFESNGGSGYTGLTVFNNMSNSTSLVKDNYFTGYSWLYIIANEGAMDITVTGNSFVDTGREGVYIEATGGNLQADISGNFMSGTSSGVSILSIASSPLTHSTITMENNMIQNTSSHGIGFQNFAGGTLDLTISGNQLSNIGGDALNFYAPFSDGVHNVLVSGNAIYNSSIIIHDNPFAWTPGTFNVQGNYISQGAIVAFNPQNLLVTGNTIEWAPGSALNFNFEGGGNVTATGNYIVDAGEAGISLSKTSGMDLVTANFTGNAIISPSLYGISVRTEMDGSVDVTIADNFIQDTNLSGVYLNATNNMGGILAHVSGNQIETWGGDGITVEAFNSARVDATIHGNAITNSGWNGISLLTDSSAMLTATVSNNYISYSNEMGVNVLAGNTTAGTGITVDITGNSILNTSRNTVNLLSQSGEVNATVTGNLLEGGYHLAYLYSTGGPINATFTGNSISGSSGQHVRIESGDGTINATLAQNSFITGGISAVRDKELGTLNLTVEQNYFERGFIEATNVNTLTVVGNAMEHSWFVWPGGVNVSTTMDSTIVVQDNYLMNSDTIKIAAHDLANVTATITGNQINYTNFDGIVLQTSGSANITATISGNAILSDPQGSGIVLTSTNDVGGITATISGNHIETPVVDGIRVEALNYATVDVTIDGNAIIDAGGNGISLITEWYANLNATVSNNYISNAGNMGVNAQAMNISEGTGITLDLTGNTILNSGYHGVNLYGYSWGEVTATLTGNAISGSLYYGTFLDVDGGSVNAIFTGNYFDDNDSGYSVRMETNGGTINATLEQNSINNGGISAVRNYQWDTLNLTVQQNQFNDGWVEASSPTTLTVVGNTMQGTWQWFGGVNMFTYMDTAVLVQDNYFANTGGVSIASYDLASTTATVTGNLFANALGDAVILSTNGYGSITADISGNAISGGAGSGVSFVSNGYDLQPTITATVTNNVIQNTAVGILAWNYNNGTMDLTITGNHISGTTSDAVQLMTNGGAVSNMVVSNNTIIGNRIVVSEDLYMPTLGSSYTVQGNHVTNGSIEAYNVQGILVTGNTVEGSPGDAMAFGWDRPGSATVTGNTIVNAGGAGIYISKGSGLDTATVSVTNNVINGAATHGIWSSVVGEGSLDLTISSNGIQNVGGDGIRFQADNYAGPGITVSTLDGNYVNQAGENGIAILSANEGDVTVSNFNGNLITDTVAGSHLVIEQGALGTVQVTGDVDNTASPSPNPAPDGETLKFNGTTPTVNFQLNGGSITMPVDMP